MKKFRGVIYLLIATLLLAFISGAWGQAKVSVIYPPPIPLSYLNSADSTLAGGAAKVPTDAMAKAYVDGKVTGTSAVNLQAATPGAQQTGHDNLSGTRIGGTFEAQTSFKSDKQAYFSSIVDNGNSGVSKTIDWTQGNLQKITTTGDCTLTFTAPTGPCILTLKVIHEASATAYTYTYPGTVKWQSAVKPTTTNTSGAVDVISFLFDGTNYYGLFGLDLR